MIESYKMSQFRKKMGTQPFRNSFELSQFQFEKWTDRAGYKWKGIFRIRKHQYPSFYREFWFGKDVI